MSQAPDADPLPAAALRTQQTTLGGTVWQTQTPALSLWRGDVGLGDWLRLELPDGQVGELRLGPAGELRVGRYKPGMPDPPELAHDLFLSSRAAVLRHDGARWWLRRRPECHAQVPTLVGARALGPGEEAPLVHGTFVLVGRVRATLVDRRFVAPLVPAGSVDEATGLLSRAGLEHEVASRLALGRSLSVVAFVYDESAGAADASAFALALHRAWPKAPVGREGSAALCLVASEAAAAWVAEALARVGSGGAAEEASAATAGAGGVAGLAAQAGAGGLAAPRRPGGVGYWQLDPKPEGAARELELALVTARQALRAGGGPAPLDLRRSPFAVHIAPAHELAAMAAAGDKRRATLLLGIEDAHALGRVGPHVLNALEHELAAVVAGLGAGSMAVARLAPGVVAARPPANVDARALGAAVQREWHARSPVVDGHLELPRSLCWELSLGDPSRRAAELSAECADPEGVLHALAGGLPHPVAGRVALALGAGSAVERLKLLFDVLEGAWRLVASALAAAYFVAPGPAGGEAEGFDELVAFARANATRDAYPLGLWRELARIAARGFGRADDPVGAMARELLRIRDEGQETLEALGNQLHPLRNRFAHNVYPEARALQDLPAFERTTREFLRALRPLRAWTLVTVEKSEPDLYGESQTVEYVDHTGPSAGGTRRRIVLKSIVRLAHVVYFVRWRDGLAIPLEPFVRRRPRGHAFDLFWLTHLPRPGACAYQAVVDGSPLSLEVEERRLAPRLRELLRRVAAGA
ncbi:MAG TPA: hypothetical protein VFS00_33490 [Polyangiaceae bacterium]|nr:hypothetical protein [Polyangiaceae bacterium]